MCNKLYLAPMDDITDRAFRELCKSMGADFMYTEFVAADSLIREVDKSFRRISFSDYERPIGIQIFGNNVDSMVKAAKIAKKYSPDEININCGCPVKKIVNKGCGSALLKDLCLLSDIVKNVVNCTNIQVTVKTRLGWDDNNIVIEDLALMLQDLGVKKLIVHCRTRSQMYSGVPKLEYLKRLKDKNLNIEIIGNGNVVDLESFENMINTGVDGVMIGRGSIGNPWIFNDLKEKNVKRREIPDIVSVVKKHVELSLKYKNERETILSLRKHYSNYFRNFHDFKQFKILLMSAEDIDSIYKVFDDILCYYV